MLTLVMKEMSLFMSNVQEEGEEGMGDLLVCPHLICSSGAEF